MKSILKTVMYSPPISVVYFLSQHCDYFSFNLQNVVEGCRVSSGCRRFRVLESSTFFLLEHSFLGYFPPEPSQQVVKRFQTIWRGYMEVPQETIPEGSPLITPAAGYGGPPWRLQLSQIPLWDHMERKGYSAQSRQPTDL